MISKKFTNVVKKKQDIKVGTHKVHFSQSPDELFTQLSNKTWICSLCTAKNKGTSRNCSICNTPNHNLTHIKTEQTDSIDLLRLSGLSSPRTPQHKSSMNGTSELRVK